MGDMTASEFIASLDPDMQRHVIEIARQKAADHVWAAQIGPAYTRRQVAALLGVSQQAVAKRKALLELVQRDGRVVYPVVQFNGDHPVAGVDDVVMVLRPVVATTWTIASWIMSTDETGCRRIDRLKGGDIDAVVAAARRTAVGMAR